MKVEERDVYIALSGVYGSYAATYVVANRLRRSPEYKLVRTDAVLRTLKRMEKKGAVRQVKDSRNPYARQYMWEAVE